MLLHSEDRNTLSDVDISRHSLTGSLRAARGLSGVGGRAVEPKSEANLALAFDE